MGVREGGRDKGGRQVRGRAGGRGDNLTFLSFSLHFTVRFVWLAGERYLTGRLDEGSVHLSLWPGEASSARPLMATSERCNSRHDWQVFYRRLPGGTLWLLGFSHRVHSSESYLDTG